MLKTEKLLTIVFGALVLAGVLACGSSGTPTPPVPAVPGMPVPAVPVPGAPVPGMPNMPNMPVPGAQVVQPGAVGDSSYGTIALSTGFLPDPKVAQGQSGGAVDISTLTTNTDCKGWIFASKPDHIFVAQTAFDARFRILAHSTQDITLVVQRPDGTYVCNDDAAPPATDPIIANQAWAPGVYKVWLGSYHQGERSDYRLAFTEMPGVTTDSLATATPN